MIKKGQIHRFLGLLTQFIVILLLASCGSQQPDENDPFQNDDSATLDTPQNVTITPSIEPYPVSEISNEQSVDSVGELRHEWTINTGEIDDLVVATDGNIYGLIRRKDPLRHVAISSTGEIRAVTEIPDDGRDIFWANQNTESHADGTFLYTTIYELDENDPLSPDGVLIGQISNDSQLLSWELPNLPAGCTYIDRLTYFGSNSGLATANPGEESYACFFHIDKDKGLILDKVVTLPAGHQVNKLDSNLSFIGDSVASYEDPDTDEIVHVNPAGDIVYRGRPEGMDLSRTYKGYETPWGDLWLSYNVYDAIGVDQGNKIIRITSEGNQEFFDTFLPDGFPDNTLGTRKTFYLPHRNEIFYIGDDRLFKLDRDYNVLEEYAYPPDLMGIIDIPWTFVGNDGNIYIWEPFSSKELHKYVK